MKWWRFVIASELRKIMAFRFDFWINFLGQTAIQIIIAVSLWKSIFESSQKTIMKGFSIEDMTLYYIIVPIGTKMLLGENIGFLSREIYEGTFTRYLLYPISFFDYKTITYLTYSVFYAVQLTFIFLIYQTIQNQLTLEDFIHLGTGLSFFLLASFAYANIAFFIELISLWADNIWSLMIMVRFFCFFLGGAYIPINFFPEAIQQILPFTPFPYLIDLPVKTLMGITTPSDIALGMIILFVWGMLFRFSAKLLWKKGQYQYTGVGI